MTGFLSGFLSATSVFLINQNSLNCTSGLVLLCFFGSSSDALFRFTFVHTAKSIFLNNFFLSLTAFALDTSPDLSDVDDLLNKYFHSLYSMPVNYEAIHDALVHADLVHDIMHSITEIAKYLSEVPVVTKV